MPHRSHENPRAREIAVAWKVGIVNLDSRPSGGAHVNADAWLDDEAARKDLVRFGAGQDLTEDAPFLELRSHRQRSSLVVGAQMRVPSTRRGRQTCGLDDDALQANERLFCCEHLHDRGPGRLAAAAERP